MPDMLVREATADDAGGVQRIYAHYVRHSLASFEEEPPDRGEILRRMQAVQEHGLPYLVAEEAGAELIGFGYCTPYRPRSAYRFTVEDSVYVRPDARGRGAGRALLQALLDACAGTGVRQVVAVIAATDDEIGRASCRERV